MKQFLEQGMGTALCAILPAAGFVLRLVLYGYYTSLENACQKIKETENRTIHKLRAELRRRRKNGERTEPESVYTDFYLSTCRFAGMPVQTLERISRGAAWMSLLVGCVLSGACMYFGSEVKYALGMLFLGVVLTTVLLLIDLFFGISEKKQRIQFYFGEYAKEFFAETGGEAEKKSSDRVLAFPLKFEKNKPEPEEEELEEAEPKKETRRSTAKKDDAGKKAEGAVKSRKEGKAQEEKRRLTEDLMKERRQISSRQYTSDDGEVMVQGKSLLETSEAAKEEYAATENDTERFEKMFRGMLLEMLAQTEKKRTPAEGE